MDKTINKRLVALGVADKSHCLYITPMNIEKYPYIQSDTKNKSAYYGESIIQKIIRNGWIHHPFIVDYNSIITH